MLMQLRVTVPPDRTDVVRDLFADCPGTAHLAVLPGASVTPPGDLVLADVARESADGLVASLRALHVDRDGAITLEAVDAAVSAAAERAEEEAPGDAADAVVWEQVVRASAADSTLSVSYLAFLVIATLIAAAAIVNDSAILASGPWCSARSSRRWPRWRSPRCTGAGRWRAAPCGRSSWGSSSRSR
ncbi:hypothetical protein [Blastococcus sp. SYSU D00695]